MAAAAAANGGGGGHVRSQSDPVILSGRLLPIRAPEILLRRSISVDSFEFYYLEMERRRERLPRYTDFQFNRPHHFDDVSQDDIEDADDGLPDAAPAA